MPIYLYLNPKILGYLLNPLLDYQESFRYQNNYAAQNLGTYNRLGWYQETHPAILGGPFPSILGNSDGHDEQIERAFAFTLITQSALIAVVNVIRISEHDHHGPSTCTILWRRSAPGATCKCLILRSIPMSESAAEHRLLIQYSLLSKWADYLENNTMNPGLRRVFIAF